MIGHLVKHLPVGRLKPSVVLEEVDVAKDMCHHELLIDDEVAVHEVRIRRVCVDHHFVDLGETELIGGLHLSVVHTETPMGVPSRKSAVGCNHVDFFVGTHLEDGFEEVQAVGLAQRLDR